MVDAARLIGVHFTTLYRQIDAGKVAFIRFGGIVFVPYTEVERLKRERETK